MDSMRIARNALIAEVGADKKYVCHRENNGMGEPDYTARPYTTATERVTMIRELRGGHVAHVAPRGAYICGVCQMFCSVQFPYRMIIWHGERVVCCGDCLEEM